MTRNMDYLDTLSDLDEDARADFLAKRVRKPQPLDPDMGLSEEDLAYLEKPRSA